MPLDADTIRRIREHIGDGEPPTNVELEAIYADHGSVEGVAQAVLRKRLAELLDGPGQYRIEGVYAEDNHWTIAGLQRAIDEVTSGDADPTDLEPPPAHLVRHGHSRTGRY